MFGDMSLMKYLFILLKINKLKEKKVISSFFELFNIKTNIFVWF